MSKARELADLLSIVATDDEADPLPDIFLAGR
jgi:hypothetical protein